MCVYRTIFRRKVPGKIEEYWKILHFLVNRITKNFKKEKVFFIIQLPKKGE